ncbi:MAG: response regulator [Candidatus Eremiobacteraeota bacterium]|nr:response regulator [Candidatus Eremiobacteraeota bacterium]MBV8284005.1 response regulator [Candidatus Eremiobacteraeota bacterium]MBV8333459.1 response regulator [Candidatus Eremiobacteraeota bacterium]MBV8722734.1 response regulator [Candidatus Eremiobacteraeota bacterium]
MTARIMVVDDNASNRELLLYLLRAFGYEVEGFEGGLAALEALRADRFDLALVDVLMPDIDGYEFARRVKRDPDRRSIALVAVTALAMPGDREKAIAAGFDGYIAKPIDPPAFAGELARFLPPHFSA